MKYIAILLLLCGTACSSTVSNLPAEMGAGDPDSAAVQVDSGTSTPAPDAVGNVPETGGSEVLTGQPEASSQRDGAASLDARSSVPDGAWRDSGPNQDARAEDGSTTPTFPQIQLYSSAVHNTFPQSCTDGDQKCGGVAPFLYVVDVVPMVCVSGKWRLAIAPVIGTELWNLSFACSQGCPINQLCSP
jgi:hypothetical protein